MDMPNLDPGINQLNEEAITSSKFENCLLSIKDERQEMIRLIVTQHIMNVMKRL